MSKIKEVYSELCSFSVLREMLNKKLFKAFFEYANATDKNDKLNKYGAFVSEIYNGGANLTTLTRKLLFENENIFVKLISQKAEINKNIEISIIRELNSLTKFASLTYEDFFNDIENAIFIPKYDTEKANLLEEYKQRTKSTKSTRK